MRVLITAPLMKPPGAAQHLFGFSLLNSAGERPSQDALVLGPLAGEIFSLLLWHGCTCSLPSPSPGSQRKPSPGSGASQAAFERLSRGAVLPQPLPKAFSS